MGDYNFKSLVRESTSEFQRPVTSYVKENVKSRYFIMVPKLLHILNVFGFVAYAPKTHVQTDR